MSYETVLNGKISGSSSGSGSTGSSGIFSIEEVCYHQWLQDYKTYGEDSSTYRRPDVWESFITSPVAIYDKDLSTVSLDYVLNKNGHLGKYIGSLNGMGEADWDNLPTLTDIYENDTAFNAVLNHTDAFELLFPLNNYIMIDYANIDLCNKLNANTTYMDALLTRTGVTPVESTTSYNGYCLLTYLDNGCIESSKHYDVYSPSGSGSAYACVQIEGTVKYTKLDNSVITVYSRKTYGASSNAGLGYHYGVSPKSTSMKMIVKKVELIPETYTFSQEASPYLPEMSHTDSSKPKAKYIPITLYR